MHELTKRRLKLHESKNKPRRYIEGEIKEEEKRRVGFC
jgi:hypothetical protein